ncbi:MAG: hypothetical protein JWO82_450 [Akkermansiaceae bacterium]|nr:hypothetical protein [Akkermansiaceae bacterium]
MALLGRSGGGGDASRDADTGSRDSAADPASPRGKRTSRSEAFRQAWQELSRRPVPREQRIFSQRELLKRWAEFDLESAMRAAMEEGWNLRYDLNNAGALRSIFADAFEKHPDEAWRILARGQFGPEQSRLEQLWFETLHHDHHTVISHFGEMSNQQQDQALRVMTSSFNDIEEAEALRSELMKSGVSDSRLQDLLLATPAASANSSFDWIGLPAGPERIAARIDWVMHLGTLDAGGFSAAWDALPETDRAEVARLTIHTIKSGSPLLLPALDRLLATGQWDVLGSQQMEDALQSGTADPFVPQPEKPEKIPGLQDWAMNLPDRPEAAELLRRVIQCDNPFLSSSESFAGDFPAGTWQHEEALLIMVGRKLDLDSPEAQSLAGQISDPARKQQALELIRRDALLKSIR